MSPNAHRNLVRTVLVYNSLFWLPWGFINLLWPESWSGQIIPNLDVYDLSSAVARTEVRAMYGGLQMALGAYALLGAFRASYRQPALVCFVFSLTSLALCRLGSMVLEGEHQLLSFTMSIPAGLYNQVGLAMYELPNMIFAWVVLLLSPRSFESQSDDTGSSRSLQTTGR
jgi:hypothetical protein